MSGYLRRLFLRIAIGLGLAALVFAIMVGFFFGEDIFGPDVDLVDQDNEEEFSFLRE